MGLEYTIVVMTCQDSWVIGGDLVLVGEAAEDLGAVTAGSRDAVRLGDGLHITRVRAAQAGEWAEVTLRVFGAPGRASGGDGDRLRLQAESTHVAASVPPRQPHDSPLAGELGLVSCSG